MSPPVAVGGRVTWTERLALRSARFPDTLGSSMVLEVHALVQDGKITALSAPYPPLPLRRPDMPAVDASASAPSSVAVAPATLFAGTTFVLALIVLLVAKGGTVIAAIHRPRA